MSSETITGRKTYVINNTKYNIIKYIVQIILQFAVRTIVIKVLGEKYLGLNGLFSSIIGFLNIAELGIGSAIVFSMYKPIAEDDNEQINALFKLYRNVHLIIALVVAICGCIFIPFLDSFLTGDVRSLNINFIFVYIIYLSNTILSYLSGHRRSLLFAYQRNDIESKVKTLCLFGINILQILVLLLWKSYYCYVILYPIFTLIENMLIYIFTRKMFPNIKCGNEKLPIDTKNQIKRNIGAMGMHQIGAAVVSSTDNIIISSLISTVIVGFYSNYLLIINAVTSILIIATTSLKASVGNLMATANTENVLSMYYRINRFLSIVSSICTICLFCLLQPFIKYWTGNDTYLLSRNVVLVLCIQFYVTTMRYTTSMFKDCAGLMWNDRWKPIIESITNLIISIILAKWIGLIGVFIGTIISTLIAPFWIEPFVLFKNYFKNSQKKFWIHYLINTLLTIAIGIITFALCGLIPDKNILTLIAKFGICAIVPTSLFILSYLKTSEFKYFISLIKKLLMKHKNKEQSL